VRRLAETAAPRRAAIQLPNGLAFVASLVALTATSDEVTLLDPRLSLERALEYAARFEADVFVCGSEDPGTVAVFCPESGTEPLPPASFTHTLAARPNGVRSALKEHATAMAAQVRFLSSGTTGERHATLHSESLLLERLGAPSASVATWYTPISYNAMAGIGVLFMSVFSGGLLLAERDFEPWATLERIEAADVEILALPPLTLRALLRAVEKGARVPRCIRFIGVGAAPVPGELVRAARRVFRCPVTVGYGLTEIAGPVSVDLDPTEAPTPAFRVGAPLPDVEIRIVGAHGEEAPRGGIGELECRLGRGLAGPDEAEAGTGWIKTGDLARMNDDGSVEVVGRASGSLRVGGQRIVPEQVERELQRDDRIAVAAVVGIDQSKTGDDLVWLVVVPADEARLSRRDVTELSRAAGLKPDRVVITNDVPLSETGKVRKYELSAALSSGWRPPVEDSWA
jgi:acyl-CoA synthetase (AMP-forming)/AMP-acid ligase II